MKRADLRRLNLIAGISILFSFNALQPASAATLFDTMSSTGTTYGFVTSLQAISPVTIPSAATIQSIVMKIASGTGTGSKVDIYSDNSGSPAAVALGTLTFGSYASPNATYTGSVTLPSAGKYWFKFSTTTGFQNYYSMTPITTGSLSGWSIGRMLESLNSGSTFTTRSDNLAFLMTISGTGGVLATSSSLSISTNAPAVFRQALVLSASLGVAGSDGLVTFYADGKKIPGCINRPSTSLLATCNWKPSKRGSVAISARLVPSDSAFTPSLAQSANVLVRTRSNTK